MVDYPVNPVTQNEVLKNNSVDRLKIFKMILSGLILITLIVLVLVYRNKKADDIESAQADIIAQAVELNNIEEFSLYKEQSGGLYQGGSNQPQLAQRVKIQKQLEQIQPLNGDGVADSSGKIGIVFVGDPYTKGEIEVLNDYVQQDSNVDPSLVFIDGSEDKFDTSYWEKSLFAWENLAQNVINENLTTKQVQIIWINLSLADYEVNLEDNIANYSQSLEKIIKNALVNFPNSRVVYLSSPRSASNSQDLEYIEPNSYESAFGVREVIKRQEEGSLKFKENNQMLDSEPVLVWGPYIWTKSYDGVKDFSYTSDNYEDDGLTFSTSGKQRFAVDLYEFWSKYEYGKSWFLAN
ncbi:MAG TPA: hypothetical protein PKU78_00725 [Candidatus Dojkabacteria bacterium]|nr:hypothetical protein [Candidatus Dojkabacteria bacterium]